MIRYTVYNMTLRRYSIMEATGDKRMACKLPIPFFYERCYKRLMFEVGIKFSPNLLDRDILLATMYNRYVLFKAALIIKGYDSENHYINDWLERTLGTTDIERLKAETERIEKRYLEMQPKEKSDKGDFESVIAGVEILLGFSIDRNMTIHEFKALYETALMKAKKDKKAG